MTPITDIDNDIGIIIGLNKFIKSFLSSISLSQTFQPASSYNTKQFDKFVFLILWFFNIFFSQSHGPAGLEI
jgi:hypothetical protein